jgi:hypothetical protein
MPATTPHPSTDLNAITTLTALLTHWRRAAAALLLGAGAALSSAPAAAQGMCPGEPLCREVPRFTATITEFRVSPNTQGNRPVHLAVRFTNRGSEPLVLGYVDGTAAAYDDRGHKYTLQNSRKLTGIGRIERNRFDPKFTLAPGESADARLELNFFVNRNVIVGTSFDLAFGVREIDPLPGQQYRLGREHALSWQGLRHGDGGQAPAGSGGAVAATMPPATGAAPAAATAGGDACAGAPHCTVSGPVLARVVGVAPAAPRGNNQEVTVRISFQNLGDTPMILNYKQGTGIMLDEKGERYIVDSRYRESVQGMPVSTRERASSQFTLAAGESRMAAFIFRRYVGRVPPGTVFAPQLAVEQYQLLPSNQLQLVREYALGFGDLRGGGAIGGAASDAAADLQQLGNAINALGELFRKRD